MSQGIRVTGHNFDPVVLVDKLSRCSDDHQRAASIDSWLQQAHQNGVRAGRRNVQIVTKVSPFSETLLRAYQDRDRAQEETREMRMELEKAIDLNRLFNNLLAAAEDLITKTHDD